MMVWRTRVHDPTDNRNEKEETYEKRNLVDQC